MKYQASTQAFPAPSGRSLAALVNRVFDIPFVWLERVKDRRELTELDDHLLRDIGLDWQEVERITGKPFWRG